MKHFIWNITSQVRPVTVDKGKLPFLLKYQIENWLFSIAITKPNNDS